jgi:signal transduction histidine kinase
LCNDGTVELHVQDDGVGFEPAFIAHAFERFSRADTARGRGGIGLGLSIVESIARAHEGRAGAQNQPERGADVWISLQRQDRPEQRPTLPLAPSGTATR